MKPIHPKWAIFVILAVALVLRVWGLDFGLPHIYHTDEGFEVQRALKLGAGVFDLERIGKGGYYYLLFVLYGFYFLGLRTVGAVEGAQDFLLAYFQDPTPFWLIGRSTTALIGVLSCLLLYLLGRRTHSEGAGLFAAALMAVNLLHVQSSHYITVDVPLTAAITAGFLLMYWKPLDQNASVGRYALLGVALAVATATKLPGAVLLLPILAFHHQQTRSRGSLVARWITDKRLLVLTTSAALLYVALEPGIVLYLDRVFRNFASMFIAGSGAEFVPPNPVPARSKQVYLEALLPLRYGLIAIPLLVGLMTRLRGQPWQRELGIFFVAPYSFFLLASSDPEHIYARYVLPLTPILWLYAGWGLMEIHKSLSHRSATLRVSIVGAITLGALGPQLSDSVAFDRMATRPDTRTIAKEWIEENIPGGSVIYLAGGIVYPSTMTAPLSIDPDLVDELVQAASGGTPEGTKDMYYETYKEHLRQTKTYHLILRGNANQLRAALDQGQGDYVLETGLLSTLFSRELNREAFPQMWRLMRWVRSDSYEVWREFQPGDSLRGPHLILYQRLPGSEGPQ